jgi:hypothetical protein
MERLPRWIVESDPAWERLFDSNPGMLRWYKKGTSLQAVCSSTSMYCNLIDNNDENSSVDANNNIGSYDRNSLKSLSASSEQFRLNGRPQTIASDITKYLSSRYLNPMNSGLVDYMGVDINTMYRIFPYRKFVR